MRREGFELSISRPRVLFQDGAERRPQEPYETVVIDVDDEYAGTVIEKMAPRKGEMTDMRPSRRRQDPPDLQRPQPRPDRLSRRVPLRHPRHRRDEPPVRHATAPTRARSQGRQNGVLISMEQGEAVPYALNMLEERGMLFIGAGREALRRHGHRRERQAAGPRGQPAQVQAADQLPLHRQGRSRSA